MKGATRVAALVAALPLLLCANGAGAEVPPPSPLPLDWVLDRAAAASPRLAASEAWRDAADERVRPAGALEDPRFSYEASNLPVGDWDFSSTPLSGHQLGLKQRLPFPGLLGERREGARAGARAAQLDLADERLNVASAVERGWAELGFAQRALAITDRNVELLRQLAAIAEVRYGVGGGLQQDVLRAQVGLTALLEERLQRSAAVASAGARLAAWLDLPGDTPFPRTGALEDESPLPAIEPLAARLEETSPRLAALEARVEAARRRVRAVELSSYPDFDLGLGYRVRRDTPFDPVGGDDFFSAGVTVRLPVDRPSWRARIAEARAELRRAEALHRDARARLAGRLHAAHAELVRADAQARLVKSGLLPQAEQSLESSRSGYEVGRIDFLSLLDSQVRLLDAELRHVRALADRRSAYAALEAAAGVKLR